MVFYKVVSKDCMCNFVDLLKCKDCYFVNGKVLLFSEIFEVLFLLLLFKFIKNVIKLYDYYILG